MTATDLLGIHTGHPLLDTDKGLPTGLTAWLYVRRPSTIAQVVERLAETTPVIHVSTLTPGAVVRRYPRPGEGPVPIRTVCPAEGKRLGATLVPVRRSVQAMTVVHGRLPVVVVDSLTDFPLDRSAWGVLARLSDAVAAVLVTASERELFGWGEPVPSERVRVVRSRGE